MASSVADALRVAKRTPVHEVHIDNAWWDKNESYNIRPSLKNPKSGFKAE